MRRGKSSWTNTAEARAFSRPSRPTRVKNNPRMSKKSNSTRREKSTQTRHVTNHVTRVVLFCFETQYFAFFLFRARVLFPHLIYLLIFYCSLFIYILFSSDSFSCVSFIFMSIFELFSSRDLLTRPVKFTVGFFFSSSFVYFHVDRLHDVCCFILSAWCHASSSVYNYLNGVFFSVSGHVWLA